MHKHLFTAAVMMRLAIWNNLLEKACDYLVVCEKYSLKCRNPDGDFGDGIYYIGKNRRTYCDYISIVAGLSEAAVIAIASILAGSGYGDDNIASNQSKEIQTIRKELLRRVSKELNYSDQIEFEKYCDSLKYLRDSFIAHYDASAAKYKEMSKSITSIRSPSANFSLEEISKLKNFAITLLDTLRQILIEQELY